MNKSEKKLGEIINKYSLEVELIKPVGASNQAFNLDGVRIKLDNLGIPGRFLTYCENEEDLNALSCIVALINILDIHIDEFNNMSFYQYAIYVDQGVYDDKYNRFIKLLDLKDELCKWMRGKYNG